MLADTAIGGAPALRAAVLDSGSPAFAELLRWASGSGSPVSERFALSVSLLPAAAERHGSAMLTADSRIQRSGALIDCEVITA